MSSSGQCCWARASKSSRPTCRARSPAPRPLRVARAGHRTLKEALEEPERQIILQVLEANSWNRNATADALGVNRTTLYKKMKRLGLEDAQYAEH